MVFDYSGYDDALSRSYKALIKRWLICIVAMIVIGIVAFLATMNIAAVALIPAVAIITFLIPTARSRIDIMSGLELAMRHFAAANGLRYVATAKPNYDKHFQPATARLGLWEKHEQIIKGKYGIYDFETYVDTYRNPFAYRLDRSQIRVFLLKLPKEFPHIYLINRQSGNSALSLVPRHFDDAQRLNLEGDFNDHFTVYTHRNTRTQALSLLAPNVMTALIDTNKKFDLELLGGYLYFYTRDITPTSADLQATFAALDTFLHHLERRLKSWKFVLPNNRRFPYMASRQGFGTITFGGKYYNASWGFIAIYTVYALLRVATDTSFWLVKLVLIAVSDVVMIAVLLVFRRKYQVARRNRPL